MVAVDRGRSLGAALGGVLLAGARVRGLYARPYSGAAARGPWRAGHAGPGRLPDVYGALAAHATRAIHQLGCRLRRTFL